MTPVRGLYSAALYLLLPLVLVRLAWRARRDRGYLGRVRERFGRVTPVARPCAWVHAVSVGEVIAAVPVIRGLARRHPDYTLLVTTTTPTGARQLRRLLGDDVLHAWLPFDLPGATRRFIARVRPVAGVIMETEVWPNLFRASRRAGVPLVLANARLSAASARGYTRLRRLAAPALEDVTLIAARGEVDAARFRGIAPRARVEVLGNLKFDVAADAAATETGHAIRRALGVGRPVWIAASTHAGEDEIVLEAHERLRRARPDAALILVPRHPERFAPVARACRAAGFEPALRSTDARGDAGTAVLLGDTMGELLALYAAADVAFVGGSLVQAGGHNPLEPAALGIPVLTGPHRFNFEEVFAALFADGAAIEVEDARALAASLEWLLDDAADRDRRGCAAAAVVARGRGSTERLVAQVSAYLR